MKSVLCFCIPFVLFLTGSTQPRFNRPHPLYNRRQQQQSSFNNNNLLTLALLFGFDFNDLLALQATGPRQNQGFGNLGFGNLGLGNGFGNFGLQRPGSVKRAQQSMNALSMLGLIDGPDLPDGPPAKAAGKRGGAKRGGAKGKVAAGGEAPEGAPAKKPRRRGPRRKAAKAKAANAKK